MKKLLLTVLLACVLLSACAAPQKSLQGTWTLSAYGPQGATTPAVPDSQATLTFNADGTVAGTSGCNSFGGAYKTDGDQVTFNGLASTLMACADHLMAQEGAMFQVLNGTASYKIDGQTLTLMNNGMVLVFTSGNADSYPSYPAYPQ